MADGEKAFHLSVLTPDGVPLDTQAVYVSVPAALGSLGVLYNHAPLITPVDTGIMKVRYPDGRTLYYAAGDGVLDIKNNEVTLLADFLNERGEVDIERAKQALARAKQRLAERRADTDFIRAEAAMRRAMVRLRVAEMSS
jgi:F-type H+-transporting ATPase subunit epsilon